MIKIENLRMTYRSSGTQHVAVKDVSLTVEDGEFYTLLGPSGCGKTTTLRCVAGLEKPDSGEITIGDQIVYSSSKNIWVPPYARNIGMVFQSYAIWPHMSVFENVAFPLKHLRPKPSRQEIRERVNEALAMVHLDGLGDRPAPYLSGGQQQRLALARALVGKPRIILLDEPLSNLDAKLREEMRTEIRRLIDELHLTTLFVTHEQIEALTMSDVVAVMRDGDIVQSASPADIYFNPSGPFIADFIGKTNLIEAKVIARQDGLNAQVETAIGSFTCRIPSDSGIGDTVFMVIRPEDILIGPERGGADGNMLRGLVATTHFHGSLTDCVIQVGTQSMRVHTRPQFAPIKGEMVDLHLPVEYCFAIRAA